MNRLPRLWRAFLMCTSLFGVATGPVKAQPAPTTGPAVESPAGNGLDLPFEDQLGSARRRLAERREPLEKTLRETSEALKNVEADLKERKSPELLSREQELTRRLELLEAELDELQTVASAWQTAAEAYQEMQRLRKEQAELTAAMARKAVRFQAGDTAVLEAQLQQTRSVLKSLAEQEASRRQRLAEIEGELQNPEVKNRGLFESEARKLRAQLESEPTRRAAVEARRELQEARLTAARELGEITTTQPTTQQATAPSTAAAALEAQNKQRLAKELELEARDRLAYVRQQIADMDQQRQEAVQQGEDTEKLENSIQYWRETEQYEIRRVRQAAIKKREAEQREDIAELEEDARQAQAALADYRQGRPRLKQEQRIDLAEQLREQAAAATEEAKRLEREAEIALSWIGPTQETLLAIDAAENAILRRMQGNLPLEAYQRLYSHYLRMKRIFDTERQQIDQMVTTQTVIHYQLLRQATLNRRLAATWNETADVLVPPEPSFFQRHRKIFRALGVLAIMIAAGYAVKIAVWLSERLAARFESLMTGYQFSVKRVSTLAAFAGSIAKLFIWIFGVITILYEFGIDPATSTGAIGLVGLIMAGMFQQIVVDFIKGLDIIAGRHYNVGDFIEVDSKFGHVIDFNVKYTRVRTLSGQEVNVPNSRCIPSRRFPEGYVDNYVDIVLKNGGDVTEAKAAIQPVCLYLNTRLEPIKERPQFIDRFRAVGGRAILRYRVRVLPGCDWVIKDYFIPSVKSALAARDIELDGEPTFFFINRIETFRRLFSRQLTEKEILREAAEMDIPTAKRPEKPGDGTNGDDAISSDKPPPPREEKPPVPEEPVATADKPPPPEH
ncbi:MAG: hypothetical protein AMXMBFR13_14160 [Phycisphaerae bacterium]